ncbi:MAG TPA: transcriptional regulator [Nitrosopumilaceae archaeon]|nr:transcriptional regulator [Nitrosopumilaceae archaeon]
MPEIWLNYGSTDVVLDIRAENLDKKIDSTGTVLTDPEIASKLEQIDLSKPTELVVLDHSKAVQKIISLLFDTCNQKSIPKPRLLIDKPGLNLMKSIFTDPSLSIAEFDDVQLSNSNLIFVGEMEFDGLFGFNTISTKLIRRFGKEHMLAAYEKRKGNLPAPGEDLPNISIAQKFTDEFEISAIEIVGNSTGVIDFATGHPSSTSQISKSFVPIAVNEIGKHRTMIISPGKEGGGETLGRSLGSLWNCSEAIKEEGLAILLAECGRGIGSEAIQQYIEGRMNLDRLKNPAKYVDGMEDLLFLTETAKKFNIGIVSILPEFYIKEKLGMIAFSGIKDAMDYILKTQGIRQKVSVVSDGSYVLLR